MFSGKSEELIRRAASRAEIARQTRADFQAGDRWRGYAANEIVFRTPGWELNRIRLRKRRKYWRKNPASD